MLKLLSDKVLVAQLQRPETKLTADWIFEMASTKKNNDQDRDLAILVVNYVSEVRST